ncbi:type II secretion system minor pseudopilin GspK [Ottowia pentelensis]|uniref:Type II secretion system protein K n=2 Tax=Ottowia pentelensis TaxID=511108 RepID=A0ABV6PSJ8_9BURK|nr:type II secretion system minor pseudopilin GspK [Pseudomonadota bacterium]HMN56531.1 type II secretion system minor pseudopilin GspK [Ottowia sp.]
MRPPRSPAAGAPPSEEARIACRQSGAALLMAMITVALVATLAAGALWRQWRGVEVERAERARAQSDWILTGALDWGRLILQGDLNEDSRKNQLVDDLTEPWAVPLAEARLSTFLAAGEASAAVDREAFVSGQISDLQARLNVMNLVAGNGEQQLAALARFTRLFEQLGLPSQELGGLQRALARAQQAAAGTPADGADAPLLPARFEQLAWLGLAPRTLALLRPYVTVLPLAGNQATPVNLNTAPAEVIYAAVPELDRAQAERLVALRTQNRLTTPGQAATDLGVTMGQLSLDWTSVNSSFFEIRGRLRLDDVALEEVAVVQRATDVRGRQVRTLWRARSALTVPAAGQ